jgi:hypothetical protein
MLFSCSHDFFFWNVEGFTVRCIIIQHATNSLPKLRYTKALLDQPRKALLPQPWNIIIPAALAITGQILVITSTWQLGITGTFLGDYFGILMDSKVEG